MAICHFIYNNFFHEPYWKNQINKEESIMSEKVNGIWRKLKDGVSLCLAFIPIVLVAVLLIMVMLLISAVIQGAIVSVCWNVAMTTMFGFQKITIFQAFVLAFTIGCLRSNYLSSAKSEYSDLKKKIFDKSKKEKMAKVVSVILVVIFELISILITVGVVMYFWNNILPQLLNIELVQINFGQSFGFAYLFNLLFSISKSDDKKSKENEEKESKEIDETKDDTTTDVETIEVESVLEDEHIE
jgi:uncharacterized protein YacL